MENTVPKGSERPVDVPLRSERPVDAPGQQTSIQETALFEKVVRTNDPVTQQELLDWLEPDNPGKFLKDLNDVFTWCRERRNRYYLNRKAVEKLEQETIPGLRASLETTNATTEHMMEESEQQKKVIKRLLEDLEAQKGVARFDRQGSPVNDVTHASGSRVAKLPDPPLFSGADPTLFDDWIIQIKNKLRGNAESYPNELMKILYVSSRLTGHALSLTNPRLDEENPITYKTIIEFISHLKELYSNPNKIHNARRAFQSLGMKAGQAFQEFYAVFLRLVAESRTSQDQLKYELNEKLTLKLQESVAIYYNDPEVDVTQFAQHCTTVDQQIRVRHDKQERLAKRYNKNASSASTSSPANASYVLPQQRSAKSFVPSSAPTRAITTDTPPPANPAGSGKAMNMSEVQCFNCGKYGHFQADCPHPKSGHKHPGLASIEETAITDMILEPESDSENERP
jgi:hypothetical protein